MLKKIIPVCAVYVLCIIGVMISSCKMRIETETEVKQRLQKEQEERQQQEQLEKAAAIHLGDSTFLKCVKGYWVVTYNGGGAFQLFESTSQSTVPQPMKCDK